MTDSGSIHVERRDNYVVLRIDHPTARNSLNDMLLADLASAALDADLATDVRAIVFTGSSKVFASGADIRSLSARTAMDSFDGSRTRDWETLRNLRTPTVAAVSGFCLGGGAELAMMSDVVVASPTLRMGLPETMLGLLPGAGGTQMLPRAVGKAVAMDMVLTGRVLDAQEALSLGLISRISGTNEFLERAEDIAVSIASRSAVAQRLAKQAVEVAFETGLTAGIAAERLSFATAFSTGDAAEGIAAFLEKRAPNWGHF